MSSNSVTIGILGGMGPRATLRFQEQLFAKLPGTDQSLPNIICSNNGSIPDRTAFLLGDGEDPLSTLTKEALLLRAANVDIVCMPCNTAHSPKILSRLMAVVPLPILDMPAACVLQAEKDGAQQILILGTEGTKKSNVFTTRTALSCMYPARAEQSIINAIVATVKTGQEIPEQLQQEACEIVNKTEADTIILGCTELSVLADILTTEKRIIDSLTVLAEQCSQICSTIYERQGVTL